MTDDAEAPSRLRRWREARGWTQAEVADLVGLHISTVSRVERGEDRLAPETKVRFARALGARVGDLFEPDPRLPEAAQA